MPLSAQQIYSLARSAGFDADAAELMTAIAFAESSGDPSSAPTRYAPDYPIGLWQINMNPKYAAERMRTYGLSSPNDLKDPVTNARVAYRLWLVQGYAAWEAYTKGMHRKFLPQAAQARADVEGAVQPSPLPEELGGAPNPDSNSIIDGWVGTAAGDAMTPQTAVLLAVGAAAVLLLVLSKR